MTIAVGIVPPFLNVELSALDSEIAARINDGLTRQRNGREMIASENHAAVNMMQAQGLALTDKYAENLHQAINLDMGWESQRNLHS